MSGFYDIPDIDVFDYDVEVLDKIAKYESIEIHSEIQLLLGDSGCEYFIGYARRNINQIMYYNSLSYFVKTDNMRKIRFLDSTTLKYSTPYLQVTEK